jgi:tetratricopeptide (TPR) repeat protein
LAHSLLTSSKVLSYFGQYAQAVDLADEAAALLRESAALNPHRYRPDLIACLSERASRLAQAGRYREALPVARQAEKALRHQADGGSELDRCLLAIHLSNTGSLLAREHRCSEAVAVTLEAVTLLESCSNTGPYYRALGDTLLNLGVRFAEADREREGLTAAERSVAVIRVFAEEDPRGNAATYSRALENLARRRHALGDAEGALEAITEAVDVVEPWAGLGTGTVLIEQYRDAKILLRCWDPAIGR